MIHLSKLDEKAIWRTLRNIRKFSEQETPSYSSCLYGYKSLLSFNYIRNNTNKLVETLGITGTNIPLRSIEKETLLKAARMFTYLNYCPSKQIQTNNFYKYLIAEASTKDIILALTSIIKSSSNAMKSSAVKIFAKQTELMQLQNSYINDVTMRDNFVKSNFSEKMSVFETPGNYNFSQKT